VRKLLLALSIVLVGTTSCSSIWPSPIPPVPRAKHGVKLELRSLEGTQECENTREYLRERVVPYFCELRYLRGEKLCVF